MSELTIRMARRAVIDPRFLAFALHRYAAEKGWDEPALLVALGATPEALAHARLCKMPRTDAAGFKEDVDRIAARFGLTREVLAAAVRFGRSTATLRPDPDAPTSETVAPFLAARDRDERGSGNAERGVDNTEP